MSVYRMRRRMHRLGPRAHRAMPTWFPVIRRTLGATLVLLAAVACGGAPDPESSELESRFYVDDPDAGEPVVNTAFSFGLENLDLELQGVLRDLEERLEHRDLPGILAFFTDDFRGSFPEADSLVKIDGGRAEADSGVCERWIDGKDALRAALSSYFDRFDIIFESFLKNKVYYEGQAFERRVHAKMRQDLRGIRKDGAIHQEFVYWKCSFEKVGDAWKIDRAFMIERHQSAAPKSEFTDVTTAAGLFVAEPPELAINGMRNLSVEGFLSNYDYGGVNVYDVDADGNLDIFMPNAFSSFALFMNRGDGTFANEAEERGLAAAGSARGAVFGDVDNDGDADLFVCRADSHHLKIDQRGNLFFENLGEGKFRERTAEAGLAYDGVSMTPIFFDYDSDGDLDLLVVNYGDEIVHHPFAAENGQRNLLYRNDGTGKFVEVGEQAGLTETFWSYAAAVCDWNGDNRPDVYVANDYGRNHFYVNAGDGRFVERAADLGIEDVGNGMGAAFVDWNDDGAWDLYVTNMQSGTGRRVLAATEEITKKEDRELLKKLTLGNTFFEGRPGDFEGEDAFSSRAIELGVADTGWGWHGDWLDYDADGDRDLVVVNGYYSALGKVDC